MDSVGRRLSDVSRLRIPFSEATRSFPTRVGKVGDDRNRKTKTERQVMKKQCSSVMTWRAIYWFMGFMALGHAVNAQESPEITTRGASGDGVIAGVPGHGVMIVFGGQEVGSLLVQAFEANQEGITTSTKGSAELVNRI